MKKNKEDKIMPEDIPFDVSVDSVQSPQDEAEKAFKPRIVEMGATLTGSGGFETRKFYPLTKGKKYKEVK